MVKIVSVFQSLPLELCDLDSTVAHIFDLNAELLWKRDSQIGIISLLLASSNTPVHTEPT